MASTKLTIEEKGRILVAIYEARKRGDSKEATRLSRQLPLAPQLAIALKENIGAEAIIEGGYNLVDVENAYGENWLYEQ